MDNMIIIGESERYNGFVYGKYKINLEIMAETDDIEQVRDEIEVVMHKENICKTTFEILEKVIEELEGFEEV